MPFQFDITLAHEAGELGGLAKYFGKAGINITAIAAMASDGSEYVVVTTNNEAKTQRLLDALRSPPDLQELADLSGGEIDAVDLTVKVAHRHRVIHLPLPNEKGELYRITAKLLGARVHIDSICLSPPRGRYTVALGIEGGIDKASMMALQDSLTNEHQTYSITESVIEMNDQLGQLNDLLERIDGADINIEGIASLTTGSHSEKSQAEPGLRKRITSLITSLYDANDEPIAAIDETVAVLESYQSHWDQFGISTSWGIQEIVSVWLPDKEGALADLIDRTYRAGLDIHSYYVLPPHAPTLNVLLAATPYDDAVAALK